MNDYTFYLVEKEPPVARVFLNRPEKKNAMGPAAWREPVEVFADLDSDDQYDPGVCGAAGSECEREIVLTQGNKIDALCGVTTGGIFRREAGMEGGEDNL